MAASSPRKRNNGGSAPLPISALPLPIDDAGGQDDGQASALPINSTGELTPAQRARLGLDIYGDQPSEATAPTEPAQPEPRLAPVKSSPALAPVTAAATRVSQRTKEKDEESDGTPQIERDRAVLTYGVSWTFFCLLVSAALSFGSVFSTADEGASPGTLVPALISILIGWVIVFVARNMGPNWGWLMMIPAVILVLGPFFYTTWRLDQTQAEARAYLSGQAAKASIDIDQSSIVSETVNTSQGCFAFTKLRSSGDVSIDVVTYVPATAQQQATMALSPRFARRVEAGGSRANQRTFTLDKGSLPVAVEERPSAPIDCANAP